MLPGLLEYGGAPMWILLVLSAVAMGVFIERVLYYHRSQINLTEFLNGIKTVLKRNNVVEAISICDATPGPIPKIVKTAILNKDQPLDRLRDAVHATSLMELPKLERRTLLLATIAQIGPLLGLFGTVLGFMHIFQQMELAGLYANVNQLARGVWQGLTCVAFSLALAAIAYAGYNHLVARLNAILVDMERAATEIVNMVTEKPTAES